MANVEIRDLDPDDVGAALRVRSLSFGPISAAGGEAWRKRHRTETAAGRILAAYVDGEVAGMARINPYRQWWYGRDLPMGGVAGVVVAPEHRSHGVGSALMTGLVHRLRKLEYPLSALYPATVPVYRALGWELAGRQHRVSVPTAALRTLARSLHEPVPVRRARAGDAHAMADLINATHRTHRDCGPLSWTVEDCEDEVGPDAEAAVYLADDGVLVYDWSGTEALHVNHLSAMSDATARALWAIVGTSVSWVKSVTVDLAPDDPLHWLTSDLATAPAKDTWWMLRLIDPVTAFGGRGYPIGAEAEATFDLVDPQLPDLDGRWTLSVDGGIGSFIRDSAAARAAYEVGPRGLAALFAGTRLSVLRRSGVVRGGSPEVDIALDAAFAGTPFLIDYF